MNVDPGSRPVADTGGTETSRVDAFGVPLAERHAKPRRAWLIGIGASLLALVGLLLGLSLWVLDVYYIPSGSMAETLSSGDRVVVDKSAYVRGDVERGDVVVFDGAKSWDAEFAAADPAAAHEYIKRVIGLPGDEVRCCDSEGRLMVNGEPLDEPYVYPGNPPSMFDFDIEVAEGTVWVLGDHRSASADSRAHISEPGGGGIPIDSIVGRAVAVVWPWSERGML